MIYEIRTYNLKLGQLQEYWKRFSEKLPSRQEFSKLGGHWYTEVGPLNQMVAIWPYESLEQRAEIRRAAEAEPNPVWPPDTSDIIVSMVSEIYLPAPFMTPLGEKDIGPLYEMRLYTYPAEGMPQVLEAWGAAIPERVKALATGGLLVLRIRGCQQFSSISGRIRVLKNANGYARNRERRMSGPPKAQSGLSRRRANFSYLHLFHRCSSLTSTTIHPSESLVRFPKLAYPRLYLKVGRCGFPTAPGSHQKSYRSRNKLMAKGY